MSYLAYRPFHNLIWKVLYNFWKKRRQTYPFLDPQTVSSFRGGETFALQRLKKSMRDNALLEKYVTSTFQ